MQWNLFGPLAKYLPSPKDPITTDELTCIAYEVPCKNCDFVYVGQTKRDRRYRQRGGRGAMPPRFFSCPPHGIFLGGRIWCSSAEKTLKFVISARKSLRISAKTFFFFFFFGDHLFLGGKSHVTSISARKSLRTSAMTNETLFWRSVPGRKICDFGQKKPSDFGKNLWPPDLNVGPPISQSWRRPWSDLNSQLKEHQRAIKQQKPENSALCEHVILFDHVIDWSNSRILKTKSNFSKRLTAESWFILSRPKVINRSNDESFPIVYCSLL